MTDRHRVNRTIARPGCLLIGAARSGTTALAAALTQHPDVVFSSPKEPHFLAHGTSDVAFTGPGDDEMMNRPRVRTAAEYQALFAPATAQQLAIEGSVSTLYAGGGAVPAIAEHADADVRLLAMLRKPTERSFSSYQYLRSRGFEDCDDFADALDLEATRTQQGFHHMWRYRDVSRYEQQLPSFIEAFGDRLKVVVFEEYRAETEKHLDEILEFLSLDRSARLDTDVQVNRGGEPKSQALAGALGALRRSEMVKRVAKTVTSTRLRERVREANLERVELDQHVRTELEAEFAPTRAYVQDVLGRPIAAWQ